MDAAKTALESNSDVDSIAVSEKKDGKNNLCVLSICIKGNKEIRPQIIESLVKAKCGVYEMSLHKNSLEDIFHLLTAEKSEEK